MTRRFASRRPIRLSDTDASGRLRLDAVARYLQDVASDDWLDAGFESSESVWVVRRTELTVEQPFADDGVVALKTWCSGIAAAAASRRYSLTGDRGGRIEAESVWIHLDRELQPVRLPESFREVYGPSAAGHGVVTRFSLALPPADAHSERWALRRTDEDRLGHVNNAVYWVPLEEQFGADVRHAVLEYRKPVDVGDEALVVRDGAQLWITVAGEVRAAAAILAR
ncbi:MAG TPA: acyl-ACP thioesterase domain-containing protein [Gaiellaceae bacterium]